MHKINYSLFPKSQHSLSTVFRVFIIFLNIIRYNILRPPMTPPATPTPATLPTPKSGNTTPQDWCFPLILVPPNIDDKSMPMWSAKVTWREGSQEKLRQSVYGLASGAAAGCHTKSAESWRVWDLTYLSSSKSGDTVRAGAPANPFNQVNLIRG